MLWHNQHIALNEREVLWQYANLRQRYSLNLFIPGVLSSVNEL